jgi:hypothetical protein
MASDGRQGWEIIFLSIFHFLRLHWFGIYSASDLFRCQYLFTMFVAFFFSLMKSLLGFMPLIFLVLLSLGVKGVYNVPGR